ASDMYYQCLDGTYDYDNDSIYGEKNDGVDGGIIDLYAEVYIGRACIDNYEQLENFVRKTLAYEDSQWGLEDYLTTVDSVGEFVWNGAGGWGAGYLERCIDHCTDYGQDTRGIPSKLYSIHRWYERDTRYDSIDLIEDIYNGVNLINHLGHASPTFCMRFTPTKIASLKNTHYGFWYSQGCHPGQFQVVDECIAEAWTLSEHGGFAAIMNTGYGYGSNANYDGPDNRFAREFWDALNASFEKISRLGEANQDSKEDNMWHIDDGQAMYHNCYSTTLFGDPFVEIKGMEDIRADFQWEPSFPKPGEEIQFREFSLNAEKFYWDFGDGSHSNERNPVHTYNEEGVYKVTLTIEGDGETDTCIKEVEIWENWPPFAVPKPSFLATDTPMIVFHGEDSWDPDGEVVSYHWDFDDGETSDQPSPLHTFNEDGIYHVVLTVTDDKGRNGSSSCEIRIDQHTPPETEVVIGGEQGKNGWLVSPAYISLAASDWSGVKKSKIRVDNGNWETYRIPKTVSEDGIHIVEYYSEDIWGNVEEAKKTEFKIDSTPPSINVSIDGLKKQGWFISPVNITIEAEDYQSGLDKIMYLLTPLDKEWMEYTSPIDIFSDGRYTLKVYAEDKAGHIAGRNQTYHFGIDMNPPKTTYILHGDPSPGGWITVTLLSRDEGIGVASIKFSVDGGEEREYTSPIKITGDGSHTITFYGVDLLGHKEKPKTVNFTIGETPTIFIVSPQQGVYINNEKVFQISTIIAIGSIDIVCEYKPSFLPPQKVIFYVNEKQIYIDESPPFVYHWDKLGFGRKTVEVEAIFDEGVSTCKINLFKIL
ncbi:MAG TPA: PKD domain-containing protein, partial [Thermoplasmatales archaeon]|nr:PKD domain-containing protein [Thermoplasmatales archaeon]